MNVLRPLLFLLGLQKARAMARSIYNLGGLAVYGHDAAGPILATVRDATGMIGEARSNDAPMVVVQADRPAAEFFQLRSGMAGEMPQTFVNYGLRLAIAGDISALTENSQALHDFVYECNRGNSEWFLASLAEVEQRFAQSIAG